MVSPSHPPQPGPPTRGLWNPARIIIAIFNISSKVRGFSLPSVKALGPQVKHSIMILHKLLNSFQKAVAVAILGSAFGILAPAQAESLYVSYVGGGIGVFDSLTGTNLGLFAEGLDSPRGLVFDGQGNLYVANVNSATINKITPSGAVNIFATGGGLNLPFALAIDVGGFLYASNIGNNTISKIAPDGSVSLFASGLSQPYGLTFGPDGDLYAANRFDATISRIDATGTVSLFAGSGMTYPVGLAFTGGNFYAGNSGSDSITRISTTGTTNAFAVGGGLSFPMGLTADQAGNLYAANFGGYDISRITPNGTVSFFADTDGGPAGLAFAPNFNSNPVPEPGAAAFLLVGALLHNTRRRRAPAA